MAQMHEYHTYKLYQEYHKLVHNGRDRQTYMHFGAVSRTNAASQTQLLTGYMKAMYESIVNDINQFGDCWLMQVILRRELPAIHVLDYSALVHVHTSLFSPDAKAKLNTHSIPYTSAFSSSPGGLLYTDPKAPGYTVDIRDERLLHHQCRALQLYAHKKALLGRISAFDEEKAAMHSQLAEMTDRVFGLERELAESRAALQNAASQAVSDEKQKLLDEAGAQAQAIIDSANTLKAEAEAERTALAQAREALDAELAEARRKHEEALAAALAAHEAELEKQEAAMRARLVADVRREAALTREALREEFAAPVDAAAYMDVRSAMSESSITMQRNMTQQLEASVSAFHSAKDAMVTGVDSVRAGMEEKLNGFLSAFEQMKRELVQSVSEAADRTAQTRRELAEAMDASAVRVSGVSGSLMQEMQGWRTQLFRQDAVRLTSVYASLYTYTNRRLAQEASQLLVALDPEKDAAVISLIGSMQKKCASLLISLEAAMRDLGMVLFTPAEGDAYDDTLCRAVNEEALFEDTTANQVRACSTPGVRMAGEDGAVLRKAEVFVREDD